MSQRFENHPPSKTVLFWSCAGCIIATMFVGFTWGGWVTGGTAEEMVGDAAEQARAEVAAAVCVEEFMRAGHAGVQLTSLKEISSSWGREDFVEEGGWAMIAGQEYDEAAELCAERLVGREAPPVQEAAATDSGTVAQIATARAATTYRPRRRLCGAPGTARGSRRLTSRCRLRRSSCFRPWAHEPLANPDDDHQGAARRSDPCAAAVF